MARALCPRVAPTAVCLLLGSPANVDFVFALQLDVANDNSIPLPMVEALAAFPAFPGAAAAQNLGAACISMCNDPTNCAPSTGQAYLDDLHVKTIPAHGSARVTIQLQLDPQQMMGVLAQLASDLVEELKRGQQPQFTIPYQIEGSVWMDVQNAGKLAASFGPFRATWAIR